MATSAHAGVNRPQPSLSVVLATYNGARFLTEQLDSIAHQTLLPNELVVSDDGSSDDTLAIVAAFARTVPFAVRILDKPARLGFADNFLFAAEQCRSDLVAFADQDDAWLSTKLETGVARLLADDSLLTMHQLTMTDQALRPTAQWDQGIVADHAFDPLELDPWSAWGNTLLFRRELALLVPREQRPRHPEAQRLLSHDTWLYILAAAMGRVSHIAQPLILYRQHDGNACGMLMPGWRERLRIMTTVPVEGYRERDQFFGALAVVFDQLAARSTGTAATRATAAAGRYRARQVRARSRLHIHESAGFLTRARAFAGLYAAPDADPVSSRERALSAIKDLTLGVMGIGTR